jgi:putative transposase
MNTANLRSKSGIAADDFVNINRRSAVLRNLYLCFCMAKLFAGKYRWDTLRLKNWSYSGVGMYYLTLNTADRIHYFGEIMNGEMNLSEIGKIAQQEWLRSADIRPDMNLFLGEFVVMPDHIHAIIGINENEHNIIQRGQNELYRNKFAPQSKNLASVIRGYKSAVTTYAKKNNLPFKWLPRYYESIVDTKESYDRISRYIRDNPKNWK